MFCVKCHLALNERTAPYGCCVCLRNHLQCIKCDREEHRVCPVCNTPTDIEMPYYKAIAKKIGAVEVGFEDEFPTAQLSPKKNDSYTHGWFRNPLDDLWDSRENETDLRVRRKLFSSSSELELYNLGQPCSSSPRSPNSTVFPLRSLKSFETQPDLTKIVDVDVKPADCLDQSMSPLSFVASPVLSQVYDKPAKSLTAFVESDNESICELNLGPISSSPTSLRNLSPELCSSRTFAKAQTVRSHRKRRASKSCHNINKQLQKVMETLIETQCKPNWSLMDAQLPKLVETMQRVQCAPEELPWRWLQLLTETLKENSEQAAKKHKDNTIV